MIERKVPAWMQETKPRRQAVMANHGRSKEWGVLEYVVHFIFCMAFWGLIGLLFASSFPIGLGLFFFFTNDAFIEWVLQKIGIRLVPDALGPEFIKAFVFLFGLWVLLAHWKDSAPQWLSPWLSADWSWSTIGLVALACAMLKITSAAVIKKLLPRVGIEISADRQDLAILSLTTVGILVLIAIPMVWDWFGGH